MMDNVYYYGNQAMLNYIEQNTPKAIPIPKQAADCIEKLETELKTQSEQFSKHQAEWWDKEEKLQAKLDRTCEWKYDDSDYDLPCWESSCGESWVFTDGDFRDNNVRYCQGCGGKVVQAIITEKE